MWHVQKKHDCPEIASIFILNAHGYLKPINCLDPDSGKDFYTYMQEKRRCLPPFIPACMYRRVGLKITNGLRFAKAWIWHRLRWPDGLIVYRL